MTLRSSFWPVAPRHAVRANSSVRWATCRCSFAFTGTCVDRLPTYISLSHELSAPLKEQIDAEFIYDRAPQRGPLQALLTAFGVVREPRAFVVAADMPFVQPATLSEIGGQWQHGDEAVVTIDRNRLQPLLALYDVHAFTRAAQSIEVENSGVKDVLARLRARRVVLREAMAMLNINTEEEYRRATKMVAIGA